MNLRVERLKESEGGRRRRVSDRGRVGGKGEDAGGETYSGINPNETKSPGSTLSNALLASSSFSSFSAFFSPSRPSSSFPPNPTRLGAISLVNPIDPLLIRAWTILSRPTKAPATMKRMFCVLTLTGSRPGETEGQRG